MARKRLVLLGWACLALIHLAVLAAFFLGSRGRRDHFVFTVQGGSLSIARNGEVLKEGIGVGDIPLSARRGILFSFDTTDHFDLPSRLRARVENVAIYSPEGDRALFRLSDEPLEPPVWSTAKPELWTFLPGGGLTCSLGAEALYLKPPGVPLDAFRLEFDAVNPLVLRVWPIYIDRQNNVQLEYRAYPECWYEIYRRANGRDDKLHRWLALSRTRHTLRALAFQLVDTYPHLLAATVAFLLAQMILLAPLSSLWQRLQERRPMSATIAASSIVSAFVALLLVAAIFLAVRKGASALLGALGSYAWVVALGMMVVAPAVYFALRSLSAAIGRSKEAGDQGAAASRTALRWAWRALVAASVLAGAALMLYVTWGILDRIPHNQDAAAQLFHARMLARGAFSVPVTGPLAQGHFAFDFVLTSGGRWFSQYPPGHILMLAAGVRVGAPWLVPPLLSGLTLWLVYLVGARLAGRGVGLLAVWLMVFSPFFQMLGGTFMNHTSAAFYWSAGLLCFVLGIQKRSFAAWLGCGVFVTLLFATRPLSAAALGAPLVVVAVAWGLISQRKRRLLALSGAVAGIVPILLLLLAFNRATTGNVFKTGYSLTGTAQIGLNDEHPLPRAAQHLLLRTWVLRRTLFDWPAYLSFAPILALFVSGRARRWDWLLLATCVSGGAVYSLYPYFVPMFGPRYWYELVPALCVLTARGVAVVAKLGCDYVSVSPFGRTALRYQRCGWYACVVALLVGFAAWTANDFWLAKGPNRRRVHPWVVTSLGELKNWGAVSSDLERTARRAGLHQAVAFVQATDEQQYWSVFPLNSPYFDSDVIYARCLGSQADGRLMQLFPKRKAYLLTPTREGGQVTPYPQAPGSVPVSRLARSRRGTDRSRPQLLPEPGRRPDVFARQVARSYPGWELVAARDEKTLGVFDELNGRPRVMKLHPISQNVPAVLRWRGRLPAGRPVLAYDVCAPPKHDGADTLVQAWVGRTFLGQVRANDNGRRKWVPCRYDLSSFAGRAVQIDLWVVATDWHHEYACISGLQIEE